MDDPRLEWMINKLTLGLNIKSPDVFEDLLSREDGNNELKMLHFFNLSTQEEGTHTLLFYKQTIEEEEEVEVEYSECVSIEGSLLFFWSLLYQFNMMCGTLHQNALSFY